MPALHSYSSHTTTSLSSAMFLHDLPAPPTLFTAVTWGGVQAREEAEKVRAELAAKAEEAENLHVWPRLRLWLRSRAFMAASVHIAYGCTDASRHL
eukprot:3300263-Rhodomonas_salina.1